MFKIRPALFTALAALTLAGYAHAQSTSGNAMSSTAAPASPASADLADGEVRKVDTENKKLTIKHGPLKNLDMPGMTMVFQVKEDAMLEKVQPGDKVRFQADKVDGKFTVMKIESVN